MAEDAHEKAIHALACLLRETAATGAQWPAAEAVVSGGQRLDSESLAAQEWWCERAAVALRALGLVAVDPALVEAVREARDLYAYAIGGHGDPEKQRLLDYYGSHHPKGTMGAVMERTQRAERALADALASPELARACWESRR